MRKGRGVERKRETEDTAAKSRKRSLHAVTRRKSSHVSSLASDKQTVRELARLNGFGSIPTSVRCPVRIAKGRRKRFVRASDSRRLAAGTRVYFSTGAADRHPTTWSIDVRDVHRSASS